MKRKRITQLFPFLLPIRRVQRKVIFYTKMHIDRNRYAKTKAPELLSFCIYETKSKLLNENTGFDMKYHMPARIDPDTAERIKQAVSVISRALVCSGFRLSRCLVHHD
ncbi:hypothetical protein [Candidatus Formimonas warabiya]|uniref:Uncharacterized protein n=1 Tax=Formimonas warabiya TaxID=1761012 RepID=A0A3G1KMX8_FORW1|nr:hypothetical protein DCMF_02655 [Candidatus Formimonas warabiya]